MKKYILILFALFCVTSLYAQTSMTDSQVMDFVVKEHKKGTSQQQMEDTIVKALAMYRQRQKENRDAR